MRNRTEVLFCSETEGLYSDLEVAVRVLMTVSMNL